MDEKHDSKTEPFKCGYPTIFDLTKERLSRVCRELGNSGFKVYEIIDDFRVTTDEELTLSNLTMFDNEVLTKEQYQALLSSWSLYDGNLLTAQIEEIDLAGYKSHYCDGKLYLIGPEFSTNNLKDMLEKLDSEPEFSLHKVVFYGNNFESSMQRSLNENLKSYGK